MPNESCPDCGSTKIAEQYRQGNIVCTDCGLVVDKIIESAASPTYNNEDHAAKSQAGPPVTNLRPDYGLSTDISNTSRDAFGSRLTNVTRQRMRRLRWINSRTSKSEMV